MPPRPSFTVGEDVESGAIWLRSTTDEVSSVSVERQLWSDGRTLVSAEVLSEVHTAEKQGVALEVLSGVRSRQSMGVLAEGTAVAEVLYLVGRDVSGYVLGRRRAVRYWWLTSDGPTRLTASEFDALVSPRTLAPSPDGPVWVVQGGVVRDEAYAKSERPVGEDLPDGTVTMDSDVTP